MFKRVTIITLLLVSLLGATMPATNAQEHAECNIDLMIYEVMFDPEGTILMPLYVTNEVEYIDPAGHVNLFRMRPDYQFDIAPDGDWGQAFTQPELEILDSQWDAPALVRMHPGNFEIWPHFDPGLAYFSPYLYVYNGGWHATAATPIGGNCPGGGWDWSGE